MNPYVKMHRASLARTRSICGVCLALAVGSALAQGSAENASERKARASATRSPRETVSQYLQHIKGGRSRDAFALTTKTSACSWSAAFPRLKEFDRIRPLHQLGTDQHAIVVSNPFQGQHQVEVFYAFLIRSDGQWLITRSDCVEPKAAFWMMNGYLANPDVTTDVVPEEVVGSWWAVCDSTIILLADGTGSELCIGPAGPVEGQKSEPFKWKVDGSELHRWFADRKDTLGIRWIDDNSIRFNRPNDSGWGYWERREKTASGIE